jgi:CTP:molybdopterin cytidylyltransferase MocA
MVEAIVLAAGLGRRFGAGSKPLMPVDGTTSLARAVRLLRDAGVARVLVVVGHDADRVAREAKTAGGEVVANPAYRTGVASSLVAGIDALEAAADGFLVVPADLPALPAAAVRAVIEAAAGGASIARPVVGGVPGFPVYFRAEHRAPLRAALHGDRGALAYIAARPDVLIAVPMTDPGCIEDVDRAEERPRERGRGLAVQTR